MKILITLFILNFTIIYAQLFEGMDDLQGYKDRFVFDPSHVNKVKGRWYNEISDEPYTGRLIVFSNQEKTTKIAECTIVKGFKSGSFVQYYNKKLMIKGVQGLYINGKKEGSWKWVLPDHSFTNNPWIESGSQIITNIEFRDGFRHGYISIDRASLEKNGKIEKYSYLRNDILLRGQYREGKKYGEWYYNEYTLSDFDELSEPYGMDIGLFYWSKKEVYDNTGKLAFNECREPWDREIECKETSFNYLGRSVYVFPYQKNEAIKARESRKKTFVIDDNGLEVEVNIVSFKRHVRDHHLSGTSVHKQSGSSFTIDNDFRKMLKRKTR